MAFDEGKHIAQLLGVCLIGELGKERFGWFDFPPEQWERISNAVEIILPDFTIYQDATTLSGLFEAWTREVQGITKQKRAALDQVARRPPEGLTFNDVGIKAW